MKFLASNSGQSQLSSIPRDIARALAALEDVKRCGSGWQAICPAHEDRKPSLSIAIGTNNRLLLYCHAGCSFDAVISAIDKATDVIATGEIVVPKLNLDQFRAARKQNLALGIWREAIPAKNTLVETYLRTRKITIQIPESLRFHGSLRHPSGRCMPAMVAAVQDIGGAIVAIHRTYLMPDLKTDKRMLARCHGHAVRLAPLAAKIAIAEGIETALSVMQMQRLPTWAALSAPGMAAIELPKEIREIIICADGDQPGREAARALAHRMMREQRIARIRSAPDGKDFNDLLRG